MEVNACVAVTHQLCFFMVCILAGDKPGQGAVLTQCQHDQEVHRNFDRQTVLRTHSCC